MDDDDKSRFREVPMSHARDNDTIIVMGHTIRLGAGRSCHFVPQSTAGLHQSAVL